MCDKDKALLAVVNLIALGTPAAKGNACYLLANLLVCSATPPEPWTCGHR